MKKIFFFFAVAAGLASCADNTKKLIVFTHDHPAINEEAKTFACKDTLGHDVSNVTYNVAGAINLSVSTKAGDATIAIPDNGYYIVNLKNNDTIIGSAQSYSTPAQAGKVITQADLKIKIDSLELLIQGKNVSAVNHNYFILPNAAVKITDNVDAIIVTPYNQLPAIELKDGKVPEVYKFYTIHEVREIIEKLKGLTK